MIFFNYKRREITPTLKKALNRIKLATLALIVFSVHISASVYSQQTKLSLNIENKPIKEVLFQIESQTEFRFIYENGKINLDKTVSVHVKEQTVETILKQLFDKSGIKYEITENNLILINPITNNKRTNPEINESLQQAKRTITGIVTDEQKEPIIGANIVEKGTSNGVITDTDGKFTLDVSADAHIQVSFIGYYPQNIAVSEKNILRITLRENIKVLDEVIVVGYGLQKKVNATGAVSTISQKTIEGRPVVNAAAALQGASPGLVVTRTGGQPGKEGYTTQVRGLSSVNTTSTLVVIDGVPGTLSLLNPNDIATISVLKDGSAAAIYGARAAGGVILITTKSGDSQKLKVDFTSQYSIDKLYNLPKRLNSWEDAEMEMIARVNNNNGTPYWGVGSVGSPDWMKENKVDIWSNGDYFYYYNMDYINDIVDKSSFNWTNDLAVSGGNKNSKYRFSLGTFTKDGIFKFGPDKYNRLNARARYQTKFNDKFELDFNISYVNTDTESPVLDATDILAQLYNSRQISPWFVPDFNGGFTEHYSKGAIASPMAYASLKDGGQTDETIDNFDGVFTLTAKDLIPGLVLRGIYAPSIQNYRQNKFVKNLERWGPNGLYSVESGTSTANGAPNELHKQRQTVTLNNLQFLADYDVKLPEKNEMHFLGGYSFEDSKLDMLRASAKKLSSNEVPSLNLGDPTLFASTEDTNEWAIMSFFGRLNYTFDNKYLFEANVRVDGSSRLAPSKRWKAFPSFSAGWNIANEKWFKNMTGFFDMLKIRGSWGQLGNSSVLGEYDYISLIKGGDKYPFNNQKTSTYFQESLASDQKTWEIVQTTNIGTDIAVLNSRLNVSFEYYRKDTKDMLMPMTVPSTFGIKLGNYNLASMESWGWEAEMKWKDRLLNGKLNYSIAANISDNANKITQYNGTIVVNEGVNNIIEGMPYGSIYGYIADGYFPTDEAAAAHVTQRPVNATESKAGDIKYRNLNNDDRISAGAGTLEDHGDLVYLGTTTPRFNFGVNLSADYAGFDFSIFFQGVGKRTMRINSSAAMPFEQSYLMPWDIHTDYWTPENPDARFPRLFLGSQNRSVSTFWLQDASYLRLKNLQLGYTIPRHLTQKIKIDRVRVYFSGQDLWETTGMWLNYFDPEQPNNTNYIYPLSRSYAFGINITL